MEVFVFLLLHVGSARAASVLECVRRSCVCVCDCSAVPATCDMCMLLLYVQHVHEPMTCTLLYVASADE